jgi:alginate O-acetyltransferase complex protein AlgI
MPRAGKNVLLLLASLFFYAWGEPWLVGLMLVSTGMNYAFGRGMQRHRGTSRGRWLLGFAVAANLGFLVVFKYAGFLVAGVNELLALAGVDPFAAPAVKLPIGISFYTFQAMSYVVDVARGEVDAERRFTNVALYIALFPQLIAGPIVRYKDVAAQIQGRRETFDLFAEGVKRFIVGLGKKMLIANSAAAIADAIFDIPDAKLSAGVAWLGIVCYSLQIYFDFSGYSDMAIGLGRMFGFRFLENFNYPYVSQSITEFWRRWHISLSTWFRDYLYIPLGGSRAGAWPTYRNLLVVFLLCGLWHGASRSFAVWGLYHGLFLILERRGLDVGLRKSWPVVRHAYVLVVVMAGWVFFRAETLPHAVAYLSAMAGLGAAANAEYPVGLFLDSGLWLVLIAGGLGSLPLVPWVKERLATPSVEPQPRPLLANGVSLAGVGALTVVLIASMTAMTAGTYNPFIYFRF